MTDAAPFIAALERAGYRLTDPRRAVADLIADQTGHFTAADLVAEARRRRLGRRPRDHLPDPRRARPRSASSSGSTCPSGEHAYLACEPTHHHHVVCSRCGRSRDIDDAGLRAVVRDIARRTGYADRRPSPRAVRAVSRLPGVEEPRLMPAALLVSFGAFASAFLGGWFALRAVRYRRHRHRGRRRDPDRGRVLRPHPGGRRLPRLARCRDALDGDRVPGVLLPSRSSRRCTSATRPRPSSTTTRRCTSTSASPAPSGMGIHSFLDGVALAAGLAVGGGTGDRHRGRRDRPPLQRRDRRRQLPAGQPRCRARPPTAGSRSSRSRRSRASCSVSSSRCRRDPRGDPGVLRRLLPLRRRGGAAARGASPRPVALDRRSRRSVGRSPSTCSRWRSARSGSRRPDRTEASRATRRPTSPEGPARQ